MPGIERDLRNMEIPRYAEFHLVRATFLTNRALYLANVFQFVYILDKIKLNME